MHIHNSEIDQAFAACVYERDERKAPDAHRHSKFLVGWKDATLHNKTYEATAFKRLTWKNLGYRLGQYFGACETTQQDEVFVYLSKLWSDAQR